MADDSNALVPVDLGDVALTDAQIAAMPEDALPGVAVEARTRAGRPPLTKNQIRNRAMGVYALLFQGYRVSEIAKALKISRQTVWRAMNEGKKLGIAKQETVADIIQRIDDEALPMAVEGLKHHLAKRDKDAIFKTLEGRGALVSHQSVKTTGGGPPAAFKIEIQGDVERIGVMGQMVGVPRTEGE